jgi:hypothetical protein
MGLTYSFIAPLGQHNQRTYQYISRPKKNKNKKNNKHKKSRISDTELINPVESTNTKIDDQRDTVAVFERNVEK